MTTAGGALFVSAGEVSGDHYIARIHERLRGRGYAGRIYGLCGAESREAGVEGLWEAERLQLIGVAEVLGALPGILRLMGEMYRDIMQHRPRAIICADSPDFHLPLIRRLRRGGYRGRIIYIAPPSVWAWRSYRARDLVRHVDENLPLFKFEYDYLERAGCKASWIGHPMLEEFRGWQPEREAVLGGIEGDFDRSGDGQIVALLPGSRRMEIEQLYPLLAGFYAKLKEQGRRPVFSVAPGLSQRARLFLTERLAQSHQAYYVGPGRNLMALSDLVAGSSGTATAEALLLERFMIVLYKVRPLSALIGKMFLRHLFFGIPNLLAGEMFYPELIQDRATAENLEREAFAWLEAPASARAEKVARMKNLAGQMGTPGVYDFWTDRIWPYCEDE